MFNGRKNPKKGMRKEKQVYDATSDLYSSLVENYYDEYKEFACAIKNRNGLKYIPDHLFLKTDICKGWLKKEDVKLDDIPPMPQLEDDEEVKEGK